jgi:uncharacterized protein YjbJ (UPF0337 family)
MQDLINKLMNEAGLSSEQASKALNVMVGHVKSIVPPAFAGSIDNMLNAKTEDLQAMAAAAAPKKEEGIMDKASDMAGQAKDKIEDMADKAKEKFAELTDKENLEAMKDKVEDKLEDLADKAEDMAKGAFDKVKGLFGGNKDEQK